MTPALVAVGRFCPNPACPDYGQMDRGNIVRFGHTPNGAQRYRRRTPRQQILETLALLAEGVRISSLSRAKGFKEDPILAWLRQAAAHASEVEAVLLNDYRVKRAQIDALWADVGHKGEKGATRKARRLGASGAVR